MKMFKILIFILLLFWLFLFISESVDLTTLDLGRHIKNGEMVLKGNFDVLKTNFYSYTHTNYSFVNHHWLTGVTFYIIWRLFSFVGLSLFYILLFFITFCVFFNVETRRWHVSSKINFWTATILSFALIPLIADRQEIRPEIFTYLFSGLFILILTQCHPERIRLNFFRKEKNLAEESKDPAENEPLVNIPKPKKKRSLLWLLPILMLLWVNLHIGFVFGLLIIGVFLIEFLFKNRNKFKKLLIVFIPACFITLINPNGLKGVLQPLTIFKEYGYQIVENKSIWFLENYGVLNPNFLLVKILIAVLLISFILIIIFKRKSFSISYFLLAITFSIMACLAVRNFSHFGLIALPILVFNISEIKSGLQNKYNALNIKYTFLILGVIIFGLSFAYNYDYVLARSKRISLELSPLNSMSAEFLKDNKISGPIFNNYDIGGYLIFHLYPDEKVFIDNRPETYPVSFFKHEYIPMQENNEKWNELNKKYNFDIIFFARHDLTPWAQKFLIERVQDENWAPIFVDNYNIIFIKRVNENKDIIEKYEIDKSRFGVRSN